MYDDVEPTCDICEGPQTCDDNGCTICPSNWNGDTGNHINCEREVADTKWPYGSGI